MPKIFEYFGIILFFYSNEHEPIHVHAKKGEFESKAEFEIIEGQIEKITISSVFGKRPLKNNDLKHFQEFLDKFGLKIVEKWVDYFIYHKRVEFEKINSKLK
ncbi:MULTISPECIES: DUF4160 domain-containing protein [Algoriphagus]|uniref:DUF4160 domain-containing protein n=2 Tax=Algoriphagus TaxID=246875 RepID=A0ABQ6PQ24_9BACT|nr:hypothetical protein Aconfl_26930 [Algoriphagus confluentis]GMQ33824.1 hypothetical protein Ataiwa_20960 [Algoriphagus taiwanensis]